VSFFFAKESCVVLALLDGEYDVLPQQSFYMVGGSEEVMSIVPKCRLLRMATKPSIIMNFYFYRILVEYFDVGIHFGCLICIMIYPCILFLFTLKNSTPIATHGHSTSRI